jgi:arginase family enzyme
MEMTDFPDDELHTKPITFMGAPYSHDLSSAKGAVLGVPFDCGVHPFRIGSRQGPMAIRAQSSLVRRYNPNSPTLILWIAYTQRKASD